MSKILSNQNMTMCKGVFSLNGLNWMNLDHKQKSSEDSHNYLLEARDTTATKVALVFRP